MCNGKTYLRYVWSLYICYIHYICSNKLQMRRDDLAWWTTARHQHWAMSIEPLWSDPFHHPKYTNQQPSPAPVSPFARHNDATWLRVDGTLLNLLLSVASFARLLGGVMWVSSWVKHKSTGMAMQPRAHTSSKKKKRKKRSKQEEYIEIFAAAICWQSIVWNGKTTWGLSQRYMRLRCLPSASRTNKGREAKKLSKIITQLA